LIYNIPGWPEDSDIKHVATTWILARDEDSQNIEEEILESNEALLVWEIDKIIPTGEIWYIKALRKLEDSDGNDLGNTKWIGPKPVFNEGSNVNNYLAPKFYIDTPYITDIIHTDGVKLDISITPCKTNIGYINTILNIENKEGESLFTKFYDITLTDNILTIDAEELDLDSLRDIRITIMHNGTQSTTSAPVTEIVNLRHAYFRVIGNTKGLDSTYNNTLKVESTTFIGVNTTFAVIKNRNGITIDTCDVINNEITIANNLDTNSEYLLELTITYTTSDGGVETTTKTIIITTRDTDEILITDINRTYRNIFSKVSETLYNQAVYSFDLTKSFSTEEFYTYSIPVPDASNDKISFYGLDKVNILLSKHIEDVIDITDTNVTIKLLTKTKGLLQHMDTNGMLIITPFVFDAYTDEVILSSSINTGMLSTGGFINKVAQQASTVFICGIDKDNTNNILIKEYDVFTESLTDRLVSELPGTCNDVTISKIAGGKVLIIPNSEDAFRFIIYNPIENSIKDSIVIPTDFRNKQVFINTLLNGNVIVFKYNDNINGFDYYVYNTRAESVLLTEVDIGSDDKTITNIIALKNGDILTVVKNTEDNNVDKAEFWLYK